MNALLGPNSIKNEYISTIIVIFVYSKYR